jgi:hypothetical protein
MASRKYSDRAQAKVARVMHERKAGTLRSSSGAKVTSRKQAIAIGLSEARAAGAKVPKPRSKARPVQKSKARPAAKRAKRS